MATYFDEHDHAITTAGPDAAPRPAASPGKRTLTAGLFAARREPAPLAPPTFGKPGADATAYFFAATPTDQAGAEGGAPTAAAGAVGAGGALLVEDDAPPGPNARSRHVKPTCLK